MKTKCGEGTQKFNSFPGISLHKDVAFLFFFLTISGAMFFLEVWVIVHPYPPLYAEVKTEQLILPMPWKIWAKQLCRNCKMWGWNHINPANACRAAEFLAGSQSSIPCAIQECLWFFCHELQGQNCLRHHSSQQSWLSCQESSSASLKGKKLNL